MLLNMLQCIGQPLREGLSGQNIGSAGVEKLSYRQISHADATSKTWNIQEVL